MYRFITVLLAALLLARPSHAQTPMPADQQRELVFANLDKSQVPTGRLAEYALPLAPLPCFDGLVLRDSGRTDMDGFRHLYAMLLSARLAGTETLPDPDVLNQRLDAAAPTSPNGAIPVAVQYVRYARLQADAETAGLVRLQNNQLFDVAGRSRSPYQTQVMFAAAPERTYAPTNTVSLVLPSSLYLASGTPGGTVSPFLDFGDGQGYRAASWNQPLSTTYATAGTKRVKVKLVYTYPANQAGTVARPARAIQPPAYTTETRESWFDLRVWAVTGAARYANTAGFDTVFAATGYGVPVAPYTDHQGATVNVRFGQGHTAIRKPFIVVEGYNTARIAPHLVGEANKNNTVEDFLEETGDANTNPFGFNHSLEQAGYDLIYIDFTEGTDDIRRNAALFEQVLRWVNGWKRRVGSTEQNVVMGESMGGLVARYGLARLVRNGYDPQTSKLILHDSPQRGAYNPMGFQALTRQSDFPLGILPGNGQGQNGHFVVRTRHISAKLNEGLKILNAPATRQLSMLNVTGIDDEYEANTFIDGPYKDMVDFSPSGGPPSTFPVIVATSDGSQCGRLQPTAPHQELTRNVGSYVLNPFIVSIGFKSDVVINALPAYGQQERLSHLRVYFTISVLWSHLDIAVLNRNYTSPANTLPYETLPGGTTNLADQGSLVGGLFYRTIWNFTFLYNGPICFVPSYSALDVGTITPATAAVSYLYGAPPQTSAVPRVARFIAMEASNGTYNQPHLRFTARNSQWIFNEMQGLPIAPLNCRAECNPYPVVPINGPDIVCADGGSTFSVVPPFGSVTGWTASPAGLVTLPATTAGASSIVVTPAPGVSSGFVTLTATISNGCFSTTTTQRVAVGDGFMVINNGVSTKTCAVSRATFAITTKYGAPGPYTWVVMNGAITRGQGTPEIEVTGLPYQDGTLYVYVYVSSPPSCASSTRNAVEAEFSQEYSAQPSDGCQPFRPAPATSAPTATLYPNPARETVEVHVENAGPGAPVTVRLFDSYGRPCAEQTSQGETTLRLDTGQLPTGLYFVHVLRGKQVLSRQQVRIEHQ